MTKRRVDSRPTIRSFAGALRFVAPQKARNRVWDFSASSNLYVLNGQPKLYRKAIENPHYLKRLDRPLTSTIKKSLQSSKLQFGHFVRMIDLGPGDASKSIPVVRRILDEVGHLIYSPVDISPVFLRLACDRVGRLKGVRTKPHLELFEGLSRAKIDSDHKAQLVVSIGPTFMNFKGPAICRLLKNLTRPGDLCLICIQYRKRGINAADFLDPYRTNDVVRFNFSILGHLGFRENDVSYFARIRDACIEMGFVINTLSLFTQDLGFRLHDTIITAKSYRYSLKDYQALLHSFFPSTIDTVDHTHAVVVSWCVRGE